MPAYPAPTSADRGGDYFGSDAPDKPAMSKDDMREHQDDKGTALVPKEFFGSKELKEGNECMVRIERVMDDEVAISYVPHGEEEESAEGEEETPPAEPPEESAPQSGGMFD